MGERESKHTLHVQSKPVGIEAGQLPHPLRPVHDIAVRPRISEQVCRLIRALANQRLRIDSEPAALAAIEYIAMVQIAMQRDDVPFTGDELTCSVCATAENWSVARMFVEG